VVTTGVIEVGEVTDGDGPELDGLVAVWRAVDAVDEPDDPPIPAEELRGDLFATPGFRRRLVWLATVDGAPAGLAHTDQHLDGVNDANVEIYCIVDPAFRRRGVARALVSTALVRIVADGATTLIGWPLDDAGAALCAALGLTRRSEDRCSRVRVEDIDPAEQRRWIDAAAARAAGYRLVGWVGRSPDELAAALADAMSAMVDAPLDDIDWQPQVLDPAEQSERERWLDASGFDVVTTLALAEDGSAAGLSQLVASRLRPALARQGDTGVVAAHRGHGLGRWLKAENLRRALAHQPGIEVIETFNAESNPHMLAINLEMGFRPHRTFWTWQGPVSVAAAFLGLDLPG
jgi:GNAT superfamily N-acetyltransferase